MAIQDEPIGETAFQAPGDGREISTNHTLTIHLAVNDPYGAETASACMLPLATRSYDELVENLLNLHNINLQLTHYPSEQGLIQGMSKGTFDGAICKPWLAFMPAENKGAVYKRIADIQDPFDNRWLAGIFVVKKDAPVYDLADVAGKILAVGSASAYEKYHSALSLLKAEGIRPAQFITTSSCLDGLELLKEGKADAAIISDYVMIARSVTISGQDEMFRIIGQTKDTPLTSVVVDLSRISLSDAHRLQHALLDLSGEKAPESFMSSGFIKPESWQPKPVSEE